MRVRTTINIDEDVLAAARSLATAEGRSVGAVLSSLARRGLHRDVARGTGAGGFPVFDVPAAGTPITSEAVRAALDDDEPPGL